MYECRETRQKWHRAAVTVTTYYTIRSLSPSPSFLFSFSSVYMFFLSRFFSFNLFFRTFPVCSEDDKWVVVVVVVEEEEEETHAHTNQWAVLFYEQKKEKRKKQKKKW